jgi:hypothetical protein
MWEQRFCVHLIQAEHETVFAADRFSVFVYRPDYRLTSEALPPDQPVHVHVSLPHVTPVVSLSRVTCCALTLHT